MTGNSAHHGGGIGSNAEVLIGTAGEEYTLTVNKSWLETPTERLPESLTVYLKVGRLPARPGTLTAENDWSASFEGLPNPETLQNVRFAVTENPVPGGFCFFLRAGCGES